MTGSNESDSIGWLFVLPWDVQATGGVNVVVKALYAEAERSGGFRPKILVNDWKHTAPYREQIEGRHTIRLRLRGPSIAGPRRLLNLFMFLIGLPIRLIVLHHVLHKANITIINIHYPGLWVVNLVLLKIIFWSNLRIGLSFHGLDVAEVRQASAAERLLWQWIGRHADALTACSRNLAREAEQAFQQTCRIVPIHNGVDVQHFDQLRKACPPCEEMQDGRRWVINIGTLEPKKGQDVLIQAFARVRRNEPDVALMIIGRPEPFKKELRRVIEALGMDQAVVLKDSVPHEEIPAYLIAATAFALPSRQEPFGIVVLEAGAIGLPVVATSVGGVVEIIEDGVTGLLVERDNDKALAKALGRVLADPALAERLATNLNATVRTCFTWERTWLAYVSAHVQTSGKETLEKKNHTDKTTD